MDSTGNSGPDGNRLGDAPGDGDGAAGTEESDGGTVGDGGLPVSRRSVLIGGGVAALGAGMGGLYLGGFLDEAGTEEKPGRLPFSVWEQMREGFRASPDHLPGTADELVEAGDPQALFEFVRDDIVTQPARIKHNGKFRTGVNGGARGALRSGMGTPRDKTELLASLLERAGYVAEVVSYERPLSVERLKELYVGWPDHEFDPGFDQEQLTAWREKLDLPAESDGSVAVVDESGEQSTALADAIRSGLPDGETPASRNFEWNRGASGIPVVKFWPAPDGGNDETPAGTATATPSDSADIRYADLFHADESFGSLTKPNRVGSLDDRDVPTVTVRLEASTADAPAETTELVSGTWDADKLAGRQLQVDTLPGISPFDKPDVRYMDVEKFVPSLSVQDPHAEKSTLEGLSVVGDAFTFTGDRYTVEDDGTIRKNGTVVLEGSNAPDSETGQQEPPEAASQIEAIEMESDVGGYPTVRLRMDPTDNDGNTIEGLSGSAFEVTEDGEPVAPDIESNDASPKVLVRFDGSGSMLFAGFYDDEREEFRQKMEADLKSVNPKVSVDFERVDSNAWTNMAEAATDDGDVIIYLSDADGYTTNGTPEEVTAISEGPPAVLLSITGKRHDNAERMADLSGGTHISSNDQTELREALTTYVAGLESSLAEYKLKYRSPNRTEDGTTRTVRVDVPNSDASAEATYTIPSAPMDPYERRGMTTLSLTVETTFNRRQPGSTKTTRVLGGWNPDTEGDREPNETDRNEVYSALFGSRVLSFESAGVKPVVFLDDVLTGKLSLESLHTAAQEGTEEETDAALEKGAGVVSQYPALLQAPLPNRATDDSITFRSGLQTTLFEERPEFGTDEVTRSVDILTTNAVRTLRPDNDRQREFTQTMNRTARYAVLERGLFETSTASLLGDGALEPVEDARNEWSEATKAAFDSATDRRWGTGDDYKIGSGTADTAAHWSLDKNTGAMVGVLPDGSGGSSGVERIKAQLKRIKQVSYGYGLMLDTAPAGAGMAAMGAVVAYQRLLAQLYALASISIATMSAGDIRKEAAQAITTFACNLLTGMALGEVPVAMVALKLNDVKGAMTGSSYGCGDI